LWAAGSVVLLMSSTADSITTFSFSVETSAATMAGGVSLSDVAPTPASIPASGDSLEDQFAATGSPVDGG
jgi:hypothetical protein